MFKNRYAVKLTKVKLLILTYQDSDQGREALTRLLNDIDENRRGPLLEFVAYHTHEDGTIHLSLISHIYEHNGLFDGTIKDIKDRWFILARVTVPITITTSIQLVDSICRLDKKWALLNLNHEYRYMRRIYKAIIHDELDVYL